MAFENHAPGWPGIPARWTSSAKSGVGTALSAQSRVWFTISHGILNEVYYPRVDHACTRDFGLIVTDGRSFFSEQKRDAENVVWPAADGVPAFTIASTCLKRRYRIEKTVLSDPRRDVVLQRITFGALAGARSDYRLYALIAPHLVNRGAGNTAWVEDYKGTPMLFAEGAGTSLAVACSVPFIARSVGFVGFSDGWQDLSRNYALTSRYDRAENGNVALTGEIDIAHHDGEIVLALGFGRNAAEAALQARSSLAAGFESALSQYIDDWRAWQDTLKPLDRPGRTAGHNTYRVSTAAVRTHDAITFAGGYIASLSIPWGYHKGDNDLGGYHLIWPRDLVETAGALLAIGAVTEVHDVISYLHSIQEDDGHWPQNCWLDGTPYWTGIQMDECAFPILLVDLAWREGALTGQDVRGLWEMVHKAAGYIVCNGPVTVQDRWEEDGGYSPFTLAVEIAALLAAADLADHVAEPEIAAHLRATADDWNSMIERWIYARDTALARQVGVEGYYVRIAAPECADAASPLGGFVPIKNRPPQDSVQLAEQIVSPDALALVRFGLRSADDPRIRNTVKVIDAILKVDLPGGSCWRRYNGDGYGEHDNGAAFDGTGVGRPWPLLTGERAHYELARNRPGEAETLLGALESFGSDGHLLPEQVWDTNDIPRRELFRGRPSGSAMPLVWAHAEHLKLLRSLADGRVFDMPPQTVQRYVVERTPGRHALWRFNHKCHSILPGLTLRVELLTPARVHWSTDDWRTAHDTETVDSGLGIHFADLETAGLTSGAAVVFTFYWPSAARWEGVDYRAAVE